MSKRREVIPEQEPIMKTEKSLEQMTDAEFVYNLDRMSRPDLITRLSDVCYDPVSIEEFLSRSELKVVDSRIPFTIEIPKSVDNETQTNAKTEKTDKESKSEKKGVGTCDKKRTVMLVLVALFALVMLVALALGVVGIEYVFPVQTEGKTYGIVDPVVAAVDALFRTEGNAFLDNAFVTATEWKELLVAYATATATVIYAVCFIVMFIKACYAIFEKRAGGLYKKRDFLFASLIAFLCSVVMVFGTAALVGAPFLSFIAGGSVPKIGYAAYALPALPVLTLLFGAFAYRKKK